MGEVKSPGAGVKPRPVVSVIMGSASDFDVMKEAVAALKEFGIPHEVTVVSAHRTPERMMVYASSAKDRGLKVIIAGAGGAAHLPGMVASVTTLPVIGVPILSRISLQGMDSLLSIVQMPPGVPVATVAVNGSYNAAVLAAQILGTADARIDKKLESHKVNLSQKVSVMIRQVERRGNSLENTRSAS